MDLSHYGISLKWIESLYLYFNVKYELLKSVFLLNSEDISAQHHYFALIQQFVIFLVLLDLKFDDVLFNCI